MRQRGLFLKLVLLNSGILKSFIIYQFPKIYCSIKIEYGTPLVPVPNPLIKDTVFSLIFTAAYTTACLSLCRMNNYLVLFYYR